MYGNIVDGLNLLFKAFIIAVILAILGLFFAGFMLINDYLTDSNPQILSPSKIVPEIQLKIKDNRVDTLYIYKLKK